MVEAYHLSYFSFFYWEFEGWLVGHGKVSSRVGLLLEMHRGNCIIFTPLVTQTTHTTRRRARTAVTAVVSRGNRAQNHTTVRPCTSMVNTAHTHITNTHTHQTTHIHMHSLTHRCVHLHGKSFEILLLQKLQG